MTSPNFTRRSVKDVTSGSGWLSSVCFTISDFLLQKPLTMISFLQDQYLAMSCNSYLCLCQSIISQGLLLWRSTDGSICQAKSLIGDGSVQACALYFTALQSQLCWLDTGPQRQCFELQKRSTAYESASLTTCGRIKKGRWGEGGGGGRGVSYMQDWCHMAVHKLPALPKSENHAYRPFADSLLSLMLPESAAHMYWNVYCKKCKCGPYFH